MWQIINAHARRKWMLAAGASVGVGVVDRSFWLCHGQPIHNLSFVVHGSDWRNGRGVVT